MINKAFLIFGFLVIGIAASAQDRELAEKFRLEAEQRKRAAIMQVMDSAVAHIDAGQYAQADTKLLYVLNNIKSVPSDLTFYFGKNSYHLEKYKQSIDWLNKYIQLKGPSGQHYAEAADYLKKSEAGLLIERSQQAVKAEQVLSTSYDIDCGPSGKVICPVCKGTTVIIKKSYFSNNDQYKTCQFCDKHGNLTCDEYNELIRGELKPKNQ
jgi:excinuclease UvrABC ATPase subunit